jgi:hypothetical protein
MKKYNGFNGRVKNGAFKGIKTWRISIELLMGGGEEK